jgi:hypothetical protein
MVEPAAFERPAERLHDGVLPEDLRERHAFA